MYIDKVLGWVFLSLVSTFLFVFNSDSIYDILFFKFNMIIKLFFKPEQV